jgi:hypothetical protein
MVGIVGVNGGVGEEAEVFEADYGGRGGGDFDIVRIEAAPLKRGGICGLPDGDGDVETFTCRKRKAIALFRGGFSGDLGAELPGLSDAVVELDIDGSWDGESDPDRNKVLFDAAKDGPGKNVSGSDQGISVADAMPRLRNIQLEKYTAEGANDRRERHFFEAGGAL